MEGCGLQRTWNKKACVGILLLLMCTIGNGVPEPNQQECPTGDYLSENNICCNKCPSGFKLLHECYVEGHRSNCTPCPVGQYMDQINVYHNCFRCKSCKERKHEVEVSPCRRDKNAECACEDGYYKSKIDSEAFECLKCSQCSPDEKEKQTCTRDKNTVCACKDGHYRVKGICKLCESCSKECQHLCMPPSTKPPEPSDIPVVAIIAAITTVGLVMVALGVFITFIFTKRFVKKKMPSHGIQPRDSSISEHLFVDVDSTESQVESVPQSPVEEQGLQNLPDCVPLEIRIPDLIYTVLNFVPVPRVKELVRSLGVRETVIEQAEMDHRQCREAHYQMLRVWAEQGSHAAGGGRGGMLHLSLMEELLDKLRQMHLGGTAEELETKYSIH
ncbi:tumor necrosis factor receptor superfamily member 1A [Oryzias melastigma]|uniref:Tumor necrosis factor receptor superfamily, member 1a n=1 Tax=Oryzias melastigma TaxID=30732 RepID=A0A3B3C141_ORYME|nr:tumor necrosis factor receptor superfamily member 1A [Oryzias melastigma]